MQTGGILLYDLNGSLVTFISTEWSEDIGNQWLCLCLLLPQHCSAPKPEAPNPVLMITWTGRVQRCCTRFRDGNGGIARIRYYECVDGRRKGRTEKNSAGSFAIRTQDKKWPVPIVGVRIVLHPPLGWRPPRFKSRSLLNPRLARKRSSGAHRSATEPLEDADSYFHISHTFSKPLSR